MNNKLIQLLREVDELFPTNCKDCPIEGDCYGMVEQNLATSCGFIGTIVNGHRED